VDLATFSYTDLTLRRDGSIVPLGPAVTVSHLGGASYRISGLGGFTAVAGDYTLQVRAVGIADLAGNLGSGAAQTSWTMDTTPPEVLDVIDVVPDPRTDPVPAVEVLFSEPIDLASFDVSDLVLERDGEQVALSSPPVQFSEVGPGRYQISGLASYTERDAVYTLRVKGSGVTDLAGNAGVGEAADTWIVNDQTGPVVLDVVDVEPDPRNTPVDWVEVLFDEPIAISSFTWQDLTLRRDGQTVPLGPPIAVTALTETRYRVQGLSQFTQLDGQYELTVSGAGIGDRWGNPGSGSASDTWLTDSTGPTVVAVGPVTPDPRQDPVDSIDVQFDQPVDVTTFDRGDLLLLRDGSPVTLGADVTVVPVAGSVYRVLGLTDETTPEGDYQLTVDASGIADLLGNLGSGTGSDTWTVDRTGPTVLSVGPVTPDPRNVPVSSVSVLLSEPVELASFDRNDLQLLRDGVLVPLGADVTVTAQGGASYLISGLGSYTAFEGSYELTVFGSGLVDAAGNAGSGSASDTWLMDVTRPRVLDVIDVQPDPRNSAVDGVDVLFSEPIDLSSFDWQDVTLRRDNVPVPLDSSVQVVPAGGSLYRIQGLASFTAAAGQYVLEVNAGNVRDAAGNIGVGTERDDWLVDRTPPQVLDILDVTPDPRNTPVDSLQVQFSEPLAAGSFDLQDLVLRRDGSIVTLDPQQVSITELGNGLYQVSGLASYTAADGRYDVTVFGSGVQDLAGNAGTGTASDTWQMDTVGPQLLRVGPVTPDPRSTPVGSVEVEFSERINQASFDWQDLLLQRDGQNVPLGPSVTIGYLTGNTYIVQGLGLFTATDGQYELVVDAAGVQDLAGNAGTGSGSDTWLMDSTPPTAEVDPADGSVLNQALSFIEVSFSEPMDLAGVQNAGNYRLEGQRVGSVPLAVTVLDGGQRVRLRRAGGGPFANDHYTLRLVAAGLHDQAGLPLDGDGDGAGGDDLVSGFVLDTYPGAPHVVDVDLRGGGRRTRLVRIWFSEPMDRSEVTDVSMYRIIGPGADGRLGTADDEPVSDLEVRAYRPGRRMVVLRSRRGFLNGKLYKLVIDGLLSAESWGSASERDLDGNEDGRGGDPYVALIGRGKRFVFNDEDGDRARLVLRGAGLIELVRNQRRPRVSVELEGTRRDSVLQGRRVRQRGDGLVRLNQFAVAPNRFFTSELKHPFRVGPLSADAVDRLITASGGTMKRLRDGGIIEEL